MPGRPGIEAEGRFVAPEAQDGLAQFVADGLLVAIEGPLVEKFVGLGIEVIHERVLAVFAPVELLAERVGPERNWDWGRTISQLPAGTVQFTAPDELSSTCVAPVSRLTASTQMVRVSSL